MKILQRLILVCLVSAVYADESYETQTNDPLLTEKKVLSKEKSQDFPQDEALVEPDPLLSSVKEEKKEETPLLEKIILQMMKKNEESNTTASKKQEHKKNKNHDDSLLTQDPLLDEI